MFAQTPEPPYVAVIFTSRRIQDDGVDYAKTADRMVWLAKEQPGYLGVESVRDSNGNGITVSYWTDMKSVESWKHHMEHLEAQRSGRERWYEAYQLRICEVRVHRGFEGH